MKQNGRNEHVTLKGISENLARPVRKTTPGLKDIPGDISQLVRALYGFQNAQSGSDDGAGEGNVIDLSPTIEALYVAQGIVRILDQQVMRFLAIVMRDNLLEEPNKVAFPFYTLPFDDPESLNGQYGIADLEADLHGVVTALEFMTTTVFAAERYLLEAEKGLMPLAGEPNTDAALQVLQGITQMTEGLGIHIKSALLVAGGGQPLSRAPRHHQRRNDKSKRRPASARAG